MFENGFPNNLKGDVSKIIKLIQDKAYPGVNVDTLEDMVQYSNNGQLIEFPYRIYFSDIIYESLSELNLQQEMILHCIYTRSCDGYVRQRHLKLLLQLNFADWVIPYIVKVCDEYIVEILEMTYDALKNQDTERIKQFCYENIQSFSKSYDRMVSYWNEFYRYKYSHFRRYIGRKLFRECFGYSN